MHWLLYTTPGFVVLLVSFVVLGALLYALPTLLAFALGLSGIGRIALMSWRQSLWIGTLRLIPGARYVPAAGVLPLS